jgi:tetratricopeptide (TPR) repeat protein
MPSNDDKLTGELQEVKDLIQVDNNTKALELLDALSVRYPHEARIWVLRASLSGSQRDRERAIADWTKVIELCDKEPHYFYMRGIELFGLGQYRNAIPDFTQVIALCDVYDSDYYRGPAYFFRADAHLRLGEIEEAKSDCLHVRDDMSTWTDKIRTKADILAECS